MVENVISNSQCYSTSFPWFSQSFGDICAVVLGESVILLWTEDEKTSAYPARHCGTVAVTFCLCLVSSPCDVHGIGIVISKRCSVRWLLQELHWPGATA